ncbi:glycosyltransferase family 2 protein [Mariniflexile jejuense]|uniref:Glycosyltransferase family 2 protein n=1 Tax=Mariniflexile jejuense TaxID=1173582 RepID=A0ABW3JJ44_9FLAO
MLAIVIPYYKSTFFKETLMSLANQTNKNFKVYIGDDASPENPKLFLKEFQGTFNFEYHRFETNLGSTSLVKQWERCIDFVKDELWIMILGDDDYLEFNAVEAFYNNHKMFNTNSHVVKFASRLINQERNEISKSFTHPMWEKTTTAFYKKINELTRSSLSEYVFNINSYKKYKFNNFPLAWYSDDMAWIEFSEDKLIFCINESNVYIRNSNENISGRTDNLLKKEEAKLLFYKKLAKKHLCKFSYSQKSQILFRLETIFKYNNQLTLKNKMYIGWLIIKNGLIYAFIKFVGRRFFKFKNSY